MRKQPRGSRSASIDEQVEHADLFLRLGGLRQNAESSALLRGMFQVLVSRGVMEQDQMRCREILNDQNNGLLRSSSTTTTSKKVAE